MPGIGPDAAPDRPGRPGPARTAGSPADAVLAVRISHSHHCTDLVTLVLGRKGVPKGQPGGGKSVVQAGGLAEVAPRVCMLPRRVVVAAHSVPGDRTAGMLLCQPAQPCWHHWRWRHVKPGSEHCWFCISLGSTGQRAEASVLHTMTAIQSTSTCGACHGWLFACLASLAAG